MQVASPSAPAAVEASAKAVTEGLAKLDGGQSPSDDTKSVEQKVEEVAQAISRQVKPFPTQACATLLLPLAEKIDQRHTVSCVSILQPSLTCSELWRPKSSGKSCLPWNQHSQKHLEVLSDVLNHTFSTEIK